MDCLASIGSFLSGLPAGTWIDIACILTILAFAVTDACRGFSSTLSALVGFVIAAVSGYWLYPATHAAVAELPYCKEHAIAGAVMPYVAAVLIGCLIYVVIRFVANRLFKLIVECPADRVLGAVAGIVKALLLIMLVFSCASLLPEGSHLHQAFHKDSLTGRTVVPVLGKAFRHAYPTAKDQVKKGAEKVKEKRDERDTSKKQ